MTDNVSQFPQQGGNAPDFGQQQDFATDLDAMDLETSKKGVFRAKFRGRIITMRDPEDIDFNKLIGYDSPAELLLEALIPEDRKWIQSVEVPGRVIRVLIENYQTFYGMDSSGNA